MAQQSSFTLLHYLCSRRGLSDIVIPLVLYNLALYFWGAGIALICTTLWGAVLLFTTRKQHIQDKQGKQDTGQAGVFSVVILILLTGLSHFAYRYDPQLFPVQPENVFLSLSTALLTIIVFAIYALLGRPVIRSLAEQAMPRLHSLPVFGTPLYNRVWHEVSLIWIAALAAKFIIILALYHSGSAHLDISLLLMGWPLTLLLIFFSIKWPRHRWQSNAIAP